MSSIQCRTMTICHFEGGFIMQSWEQITLEEFVEVERPEKLICCSMTKNYHWIRITQGDTPEPFKNKVSFVLHEFDYLYLRTADKDELLNQFKGTIQHVPFNFGREAIAQ